MPLALVALFAAAFAIGTTEFVIAGILPAVAADLHISIPTAGNLVSLYALGVAVGGPMLALWTGHYSRKRLLLVYVAIFTAGHVLCALAPSYELLLASRVMIALVHGAYFGTAMILAASVVPENRRGFAASLLLAGLTIANIVGVPLGTAIGTEFHWRITFWAIGALGVIAGILILLLLPSDRPVAPARGNLRRELNALSREPVYSSLAIIILQTVGQFALFTYISPLLTDVAGIPTNTVPWLLLLFGVGSTLGVFGGGRLADWKLMPSLVAIMVVMVIIYLLMAVFSWQPIVLAILVLIWGALAFGFGAPVQVRILSNARDAPTLAANLIPSAFNVSIAGGAWFGGTLIDAGFSYAILPWIGAVSAGLAALVAIASWMKERRAT